MSVVAPEDHEVERTDWRERRRAQKAEALEAVQRQVASGELMIRTVTDPQEAARFGIDLEEVKRRREAEQAAVERKKRTAPLPRAKAGPADPKLVARLRDARAAEVAGQDPKAEVTLNGLMLAAFESMVASRIAEIVDLPENVVRNRLAAERRRRGDTR